MPDETKPKKRLRGTIHLTAKPLVISKPTLTTKDSKHG